MAGRPGGEAGTGAGQGTFSPAAVRAAYDAVAEDYEAAFGTDLDRLALDREMLARAGAGVPDRGIALDLGCGTGAATALVARSGPRALGLDLSLGMLAIARARGLAVGQADGRRLPVADGSLALVVAYYVVQHLPRDELAGLLAEVARALRPGGRVLLSAHFGAGSVTSCEFLGHRIEPLAGTLFELEELRGALGRAGFAVEAEEQRWPLEHEYPSRRAYLLARK